MTSSDHWQLQFYPNQIDVGDFFNGTFLLLLIVFFLLVAMMHVSCDSVGGLLTTTGQLLVVRDPHR